MPDPEPRLNRRLRSEPNISCGSCEQLLRKVNQARMHALLAATWASMREKQNKAKLQAQSAVAQLEEAFRELEDHWRDFHGRRG